MITRFIVYRYSSIGDGVWNSSPTDVSEVFGIRPAMSLGETKDTFSFKITNCRNAKISEWQSQDRIEIYLSINNTTASASNLLINGLVKNVIEDVDDKGKFIRIEGVSFGEIVTNGLVFYSTGSSHSQDVMTFLNNCRNSIQLRNANFGITWNAGNPTVKSNGQAFPVLNSGSEVKEFDKSFSAILDKYLQDAYTGDGRYYWYINSSKELVIRRRDNAIKTSLIEGIDFKSAKYSLRSDDVKNYIVIKCGNDLNNNKITTRYDDPVSRAKYGFKYYMLIDEQISQKIKAENPLVSNNDTFRELCKAEGRKRGEAYCTAHNKGYKTVTLSMMPTVSYGVGDKLQITAPSYGLTREPMRINDIQWSLTSTDITLIEEVAQ